MNTISENSNSSINLVLSTSTTVPLKSTIAASPFSAIISTDLNNSISFLSEISAINDVTPITNISGSSASTTSGSNSVGDCFSIAIRLIIWIILTNLVFRSYFQI
ncbi:unnamed protein product [Rotaria sordida]|uniref:Uncharacterized protein n=1 Tax=Rotaria sordida TaxID=392033 RepID=A0A815TMC4_9BILA|nr:unnamed protein product [Rotaria sordida]